MAILKDTKLSPSLHDSGLDSGSNRHRETETAEYVLSGCSALESKRRRVLEAHLWRKSNQPDCELPFFNSVAETILGLPSRNHVSILGNYSPNKYKESLNERCKISARQQTADNKESFKQSSFIMKQRRGVILCLRTMETLSRAFVAVLRALEPSDCVTLIEIKTDYLQYNLKRAFKRRYSLSNMCDPIMI
ncbi:hypothetical protein J6590_036587 [Homalodisca vitripennis]|nr:hypothetical protein J6590_036587 [Homalodisca vitripennis]